jgi:hypothetical protein
MKRIILIILTSLIISSCNESPSCPDGYKYFSEVVSIKMELIEKNVDIEEPFNGKTYASVRFFEEITKIKSRVKFGEISHYENKVDFFSDKEKWLSWCRENKCLFLDQ